MASGGASMGIDLAMRSFATDGQVPRTVGWGSELELGVGSVGLVFYMGFTEKKEITQDLEIWSGRFFLGE